MKYRTFKIFCILTLALMVLTGFVIPMATTDTAAPATVMGTVTVNNVPTDGISVSGGGGSDTTHGGGKYAFDVSPDVSISITATYNGHSASTGAFTVKSEGKATKNLNINYATATPVPTATPKPSSTAAPTSVPSQPTSAPNNPQGPVVTAVPPPDPTYYPTQSPLLGPSPVPTINTSVPSVTNSSPVASTGPDGAGNQSTDLGNVGDNKGLLTPTAAPVTQTTQSPGFKAILLLAAFLSVAYLFAIRGDNQGKHKKK